MSKLCYQPMPRRCETCIFREDGRRVELRLGRLAEIQAYLLVGKTHLCHTDETKACRGGRDFQLQCWARMGLIAEATDAALEEAMGEVGL